MKIGANIPSMRAYSNMSKAHTNLGRSTERLSSGTKINKSSDDPAGFSIGNRIDLQTRGISQASENSANGVSLLQTAEGAMGQIHEMLQRIRELCVKGANETNGTDDREKIQNEISQLINEIDSVSNKTEYNKIKVLNGEAGRIIRPENLLSKNAQILNVSPNVPFGEINIGVMAEETYFTFLPDASKTNPDLSLFIGKNVNLNGINVVIEPNETMASLYTKMQTALNHTNFEVTKGTGGKVFNEITAYISGSRQNLDISGDRDLIDAIGLEGFLQGKTDYTKTPAATFVISPTATFPTFGTDATVSIATGNTFTPNATYFADGGKISIFDLDERKTQIDLNNTPSGSLLKYTTNQGPISIQVGANKDMGMYLDIPKIDSEVLGIENINIMTSALASDAITISDNSVNMISGMRSRLGAYLNRLESSIANLDNAAIDSRLSYSRIMDTDIALEMSEYSKNNLIYEVGTAILAKSNKQQESILDLIR